MTGNHAKLVLLALLGQGAEGVGLAKFEHLLLGVSQEQVEAAQHDKGQRYLLVVALLEGLYQNIVGYVPEESE